MPSSSSLRTPTTSVHDMSATSTCEFDCIVDPRTGRLVGDCRAPYREECLLNRARKAMVEAEMREYDALSPDEREELAESGWSVARFLRRKKERDLYAELFAGDTGRRGR